MKQAEDKFRQPDMKTSEVIVSQLDGKLIDKDSRTHLADTDFTMSEVAYKEGMSPKQFAKFFKDEYGSLPSKYV